MVLGKSSTLREVLSHPEGKKIIEKYFSKELKSPFLKFAMKLTLEQIAQKSTDKKEAQEFLEKIHKELQQIY